MYAISDQTAAIAGLAYVTNRLAGLLSGLRGQRLTKEEFGRIEGATVLKGKDEPRGQLPKTKWDGQTSSRRGMDRYKRIRMHCWCADWKGLLLEGCADKSYCKDSRALVVERNKAVRRNEGTCQEQDRSQGCLRSSLRATGNACFLLRGCERCSRRNT
jgi:hypothetical protein